MTDIEELTVKVTITIPKNIDCLLEELMPIEDRSKSYLVSKILKEYFGVLKYDKQN